MSKKTYSNGPQIYINSYGITRPFVVDTPMFQESAVDTGCVSKTHCVNGTAL